MQNQDAHYRRNVALDVVLTLLMCGLWNIVVQYEQIKMLNALLKEERFPYWKIGLLVLLTCGIYLQGLIEACWRWAGTQWCSPGLALLRRTATRMTGARRSPRMAASEKFESP